MRAVLQRVNHAYIDIEGNRYSEIQKGLCLFMGIEMNADEDDLPWLVRKVLNMRIFSDDEGKMNLSLMDIEGELLLVSQFTLHASTKKGNRPSFILAEKPDKAKILYQKCIKMFKKNIGDRIQTGVFGGDMKVGMENDGPVTIIVDTKEKW